MLSIQFIADAEYYLNLAREDYYLEGGEPPGLWIGQGTRPLGLSGRVEKDALRALLRGFSPTGQALIQNAGDPSHQAAWDLTFSAPKSVSAIWAVANETTRKELQAAQLRAVTTAIGYLEKNAARSRRGKAGAGRDKAHLVVAAFEHGTSRAQDPQLHTHCLVLNVAVRPDGSTGTIESKPLYVHKMTAGAVYRAALAHELSKLGFRVSASGSLIQVDGVPGELLRTFSKRREAILEALSSFGAESAKAAEVATLATRPVKEHVCRADLLEEWKKTAAAHGFTHEAVEALRSQKISLTPDLLLARIVANAVKALSEEESYFARHELLRKVAEAAAPHGFEWSRIENAVDRKLADKRTIISLGQIDREDHFTTKELFDTETRVLQGVETLSEANRPQVTESVLAGVLARHESLSEEQRQAILHLMKTQGAIHVVNGLPGTGKTTMLAACREAWENSGFHVVGCALSAKAARELSEGAGIESHTIAKLTYLWDRPLLDRAKHTVRQLVRAAEGKPTYAPEKLPLDSRTVLVIDEAGMVDTRQMEKLLKEVETTGARLVLVGDTRQLPSIGPGGAFKSIAQKVGSAEMNDMSRQRNYRDIEALRLLAEGKAQEALESFSLREMLVVADTKEEAIKKLVADWAKEGLFHPKDSAIITTTNREAKAINALCQAERLKATGQSTLLKVEVNDERFFAGDRVLFLQNNRLFGVLNGDLGTVVSVHPLTRAISVQLDSRNDGVNRLIHLTLKDYDKFQLGYARTTHKEQGATLERSYVLLGGSMQDKEISFVQASRHRDRVRFYADRMEAGPTLEGLAWQMSQSNAKELAHDILVRGANEGGASASKKTADSLPDTAIRADRTREKTRSPENQPMDESLSETEPRKLAEIELPELDVKEPILPLRKGDEFRHSQAQQASSAASRLQQAIPSAPELNAPTVHDRRPGGPEPSRQVVSERRITPPLAHGPSLATRMPLPEERSPAIQNEVPPKGEAALKPRMDATRTPPEPSDRLKEDRSHPLDVGQLDELPERDLKDTIPPLRKGEDLHPSQVPQEFLAGSRLRQDVSSALDPYAPETEDPSHCLPEPFRREEAPAELQASRSLAQGAASATQTTLPPPDQLSATQDHMAQHTVTEAAGDHNEAAPAPLDPLGEINSQVLDIAQRLNALPQNESSRADSPPNIDRSPERSKHEFTRGRP